jgi:hypothetical protein
MSSPTHPAGLKSPKEIRDEKHPTVSYGKSPKGISEVPLFPIKGIVLLLPAQTWEQLQNVLQDVGGPAHSSLAGPELSSEYK